MGKNKKKGNKKNAPARHQDEPRPEPKDVEDTQVVASEEVEVSTENQDITQISDSVDNTDANSDNDNTPSTGDAKEDVVTVTETKNTQDENNSQEIESLKKELEELKKELAAERSSKTTTTGSESSASPSEELSKVQEERDHFEEQYNTLLSRISSMKSIFSKMKESQLELETAKEQLSEYESHNLKLKNKISTLTSGSEELKNTIATLNKEFSSLGEENESLSKKVIELEEVISSNETKQKSASDSNTSALKRVREQNEKLNLQIEDLTMLLESHKQDLAELKTERDELKESLASVSDEREVEKKTIESLTNDLEKIQGDHVSEIGLKEREIAALRVQLDSSVEKNKETSTLLQEYQSKVDTLQMSLAEGGKFEKQAKDQSLQIGKLKHEAIILNEHLKKALAMLKQSSDSETVDKELISNLLISFVSIPRADPKKFEVLELLSSFLNWDDDKKRQAGLIYDSDKNSNGTQQGSKTQSFVALWTEFLEKESEKDS